MSRITRLSMSILIFTRRRNAGSANRANRYKKCGFNQAKEVSGYEKILQANLASRKSCRCARNNAFDYGLDSGGGAGQGFRASCRFTAIAGRGGRQICDRLRREDSLSGSGQRPGGDTVAWAWRRRFQLGYDNRPAV